jgi:hypothetical protein
MDAQSGIDAFRQALGADPGAGPGSHDVVWGALRELRHDPRLRRLLAAAFAPEAIPRDHTGPLRLLAALRALALAAPSPGDHPLAPEVLLDAVAPGLPDRLGAALEDPGLVGWLRDGGMTEPAADIQSGSAIRQVDPARAAAWGLVSLVLGLPHRGFDLIERDAGAGLGLVVDRTAIPFRMGTHLVQGFDFPSPERRDGFDPSPIPVTGPHAERALRWLHACIWPGETDRLTRLKATLSHRTRPWPGDAPPAVVHPTRAASWEDLLAEAAPLHALRPTLLLELATPADPGPAPDAPWAALPQDARALWLRAVRTGLGGARALRFEARLLHAGAEVSLPLAEVGFHGANLTLDLAGPAALRDLWRP